MGLQWFGVVVTIWTLSIGVHGLPWSSAGVGEIMRPGLLTSSVVGYSRQYKIPVQNIVLPRVGGMGRLAALGWALAPLLSAILVFLLIAVGEWFVLRYRMAVGRAFIPATVAAMLIAELLVAFGAHVYLELTFVSALLAAC